MAIKNQNNKNNRNNNNNQKENKNNNLDIRQIVQRTLQEEKESSGKREAWKFVLMILAEVGIVAAIMLLGMSGIL